MVSRHQVDIDLNLHDKDVAPGLLRDAKAADKFGDSLEGAAKDSGVLSKKIAETEAEIKKLTKAINETGDLDLLKSIRKEQGTLRSLKRLLPSPEEAVELGSKTGEKFGESLTLSLRSMRGPAIAVLAGIGLAAAPGIGAVVAGAVLGAAGTGGIIGGIFAAAQDQRVQDEAKRIGKRFTSGLTDAGSPFVEPLIESLRILDDAGDRFANNFAKIGQQLAPVLVPLAKGLAGFADDMMPGLIKAADAMKPVLRALANELPKIGREIGDFFSTISEDSDGAVLGIVAISQAIRGTIRTAGELISALSKMYSASLDFGIAVVEVEEKIFGWIPLAGDAIHAGADALREQRAALDKAKDGSHDFAGGIQSIIRAEEEVEKATKTATDAIDDQIKAMDKMFGRYMDPQQLLSNYIENIDRLTESVEENGKHWDLNSEAGRRNQEAIRNIAESIKEIRDKTIELTGDVQGANTVYYEQVEALRQQAIKLGMSKQAANEMAAALRDIPRQVDVEIRAPGLLEAIARAQLLNRLMGSISAGARARAGDDSGFGGGRAGGGPMDAGKWYTVGENGVEVVAMHPGGGATVYNNKQTGAMMSGASGGAMVARPVVNISMRPSGNAAMDALIQMLWPYILKQVSVEGGDLSVFGAAQRKEI